jgi:hypothetical protein
MNGKRSSSGLSAGLGINSFLKREPPRDWLVDTDAVEAYAMDVPVTGDAARPNGDVSEMVVPLYVDLRGGENGRLRPDEAFELIEFVWLRPDKELPVSARCWRADSIRVAS